VRGVVQDTVSDDEIKIVVRKRRIHKVRLHYYAIWQMLCIGEDRKGCIRNIQGKDITATMLSNETCVESRSRPHFQHTLTAAVESNQCVPVRKSEFFAVPAKEEILVLRLDAIALETPPFVGKRHRCFGLLFLFAWRRLIGRQRQIVALAEIAQIR